LQIRLLGLRKNDAFLRASAFFTGDQLLEGATGVFGADSTTESAEPAIDVKTLHAKIGELTLVNDFMSGALGKAGLLPGAKR
jgi:hypothetical protein